MKLLRIMKLIAILLTTTCLQVSAYTSAQVSFSLREVGLDKVFTEIERQTGMPVLFNWPDLTGTKKVTLQFTNATYQQVLQKALEGQPLAYEVKNGGIVVYRRKEAQQKKIDVRGRLLDKKNEPVAGATITVKGSTYATVSNEKGEFFLPQVDENAVLIITSVTYQTREYALRGKTDISITIELRSTELAEVTVKVSSGYAETEKLRTTGSYVSVDNELFNRKVGTDIISRIDGIVPGVLFDKRVTSTSVPGQSKIQIRGLSTLTETNGVSQPLIVVDNFPYEGNLNDLNPNDVETITILRDAAAASIWGAKAGNGVIVITTKRGKYNQPFNISINSNITIADIPNLKDMQRISSGDFVDMETMLFNNGFYDEDISNFLAPLSPVVDVLLKRRNSQITPEDSASLLAKIKQNDNLNDFKQYYRREINQQYALNISGGSQAANYYFSIGYDKNLASLQRNNFQRISLRSVNTFQPIKNLEASLSLGFTRADVESNNSGWNNLAINNRNLPPYYRLIDENGNPTSLNLYRNTFLDTVGNGKLLNWDYKPLQDLNLNDNTQQSDAIIAGLRVKYNITKNLTLEGNYQYQKTSDESRILFGPESYYTRDLINLFTDLSQPTLVKRYPIPIGGILDLTNSKVVSQNLRGQMNYQKSWHTTQFRLFGGGEIRKIQINGKSTRDYGFTDRQSNTLVDYINAFPTTIGSVGLIPRRNSFISKENRFVSLYANGEVMFDKKYIISASARNDASNVFGVKTNQKGRPFWSGGLSWIASNEGFYRSEWLPYLKLRATYGFSGNIDPSVTALTIVRYTAASNNPISNIPFAALETLPNPHLRWEKVGQLNTGIDFGFKNGFISGSIDYYQKNSRDILYNEAIDPTTGSPGIKSNSARMKGEGIDIGLTIRPIQTKLIKLETNISFSYATYKVSHIAAPAINKYFVGGGELLSPRQGYNPYVVAAFKWGGLDPLTGDPIGFINGKPSTNYDSIVSYATTNDVVVAGSNIPKYYGNMLNTIRIGELTLSANITYRMGYYLIKPSLNYTALFSANSMHRDYAKRWQQPGDELKTSVPSLVYPYNTNRDYFYNLSAANLIKGDHIRLEDVRLSYGIQKSKWKKLPFKSIDAFVYLSNLNILLWRANSDGIDPAYPQGLKDPKRYSVGLKLDL